MDKIQQSIDFLRKLETDEPFYLGFSGGKDSVVILDLAERAGVRFTATYANTTWIHRVQSLSSKIIIRKWLFGIRKNHFFSL